MQKRRKAGNGGEHVGDDAEGAAKGRHDGRTRTPRQAAASVTRTPVPGEATTINEVIKNSMLSKAPRPAWRRSGPEGCYRHAPRKRATLHSVP
jgi:hypothetical protein